MKMIEIPIKPGESGYRHQWKLRGNWPQSGNTPIQRCPFNPIGNRPPNWFTDRLTFNIRTCETVDGMNPIQTIPSAWKRQLMPIYAHLCSFMLMSCSYRPTGWPLRRTRSLWAMRRTSLPPAPHHLLHLQQSQVVNQLTLTCRPPDGAAIVVHDRRRSASTRIPRASPENPRSLLGEKWPELPVASARWRHAGPRPNPRHDRNSGANQDVTRHRIENMRHGWNYSAVSRRLHCLTFISESHRRHLGRWRRFARFDAGLNRYPFFENWPGCSKPSSTKFFFEICRFGTRWRFNSR